MQKMRNGRTGTKWCDRTQESSDDICPQPVKPAEYFSASLRRKITLNERNNKNQYTEKHHNFDAVIKEKLNTVSDPTFNVKTEAIK